jgi:myo-inositol 2-dehydrogenase/D-chiro-inositol 1-dehydrogenase
VARARGIEIAAVADPTARGEARRVGTPPESELLASGPLDGIVICCTPERHEEAATQAVAAGLEALVEKPLASDAAGALRLAALAPAPYAGFNRRFDQGVRLARHVPAAGELELQLVLHYRRAAWRPL